MSAGPERPSRPATVPADAVWNADLDKWELVARDGAGALDGERRLFRSDGTLYTSERWVAGVQEGRFALYHPDGAIAREGTYREGQLDGVATAYASADPAADPLRSCCVPDN